MCHCCMVAGNGHSLQKQYVLSGNGQVFELTRTFGFRKRNGNDFQSKSKEFEISEEFNVYNLPYEVKGILKNKKTVLHLLF